MPPLIGVDLDNTIISYDALFYSVALEQGLVGHHVRMTKDAVRAAVRALSGGEQRWRELQAAVYGPRIAGAVVAPGVKDFLRLCLRHGLSLTVISHKTRLAACTDGTDLREAALGWMEENGMFPPAQSPLRPEDVYFSDTRAEKVARIASSGCCWFIDDLPEVFAEAGFPTCVEQILYRAGACAGQVVPGYAGLVMGDWEAVSQLFRSRLNLG